MKINKFCPLIFAAVFIALGCHRAGAFDSSAAVALSPPNPGLDLARQLNDAFVQVAEKASATVVVITVEQTASAARSDESQDDGSDPLDQFHRFFHQQVQPQDAPQEKTTGQGSGIIIRKDGYILTNGHVVEDADKIEVKLRDGRTFPAHVRGVDALGDVAVIKIDAKDLLVATLADSDKTHVGEFAIAIGAPFALDYSVTFGHVSAKNRSNVILPSDAESAMMDQSFIQTDANINPGNSGGPLVNIDGEVIGINTLIRGLHTGIGFAIPSNMARQIADKLISDGKFPRPWLGISIDSLQDYTDLRELIQRSVSAKDASPINGVVVSGIFSDGPSAGSKLRTADLITAVDGKSVTTPQELKNEIRTKQIGQNVTLDVFRLSKNALKPMKIVVQPGEWVDTTVSAGNGDSTPEEQHSSDNALGLSIKPLTPELAKKLSVKANAGVMVTHVDRDGLAYQNGIEQVDVITSIDDRPMTSAQEFLEAMREVDVKKGTVIHFISEGTAKFEILKETPQ
jgi:serine protease Do